MSMIMILKRHESIIIACITVLVISSIGFLYNKTAYYNVVLILGILFLVILFMIFAWGSLSDN